MTKFFYYERRPASKGWVPALYSTHPGKPLSPVRRGEMHPVPDHWALDDCLWAYPDWTLASGEARP
jgi:hypothetical protein